MSVPGLCAEVLVDRPSRLADRPLTYRVPPALREAAAVGVRVQVPLGSRRAWGFVVDVGPCAPDPAGGADRPGAARRIRDLLDVPDPRPLFSPPLLALAREIASETLAPILDAVECLVPPEVARRAAVRPRPPQVGVLATGRPAPAHPGRRQAAILDALADSADGVPVADLIRAGGRAALRRLVASGAVRLQDATGGDALNERTSRTPLTDRDGVDDAVSFRPVLPGSPPAAADAPVLLLGTPDARAAAIGEAAAAAVRGGGQAIAVVPEIVYAAPLARHLAAATGGRVELFHSGLPPARRRDVWLRARQGDVDVVVGTRSALFAPLGRLRFIAVDDEQDPAYKADAAPRYHGRDVALRRGALEGVRVLLGSYAPSVETYAAAAAGRLTRVRAPVAGPPPRVSVVDMRAERQRGHAGYLSRALVDGIRRHLRRRGRIALLASRGGYARVLWCQECGAAVRCPRCDLVMPYERDTGTVRCRACGRTQPAPDVCPRCRGAALRWLGAGTRRVEEIVQRLFPAVRTERLDAETASRAGAVVGEFQAGRIRVVVGTPLLLRARGARPTLVGVLDADAPLYRPDFRAAERALQQLRAAAALLPAGPAAEDGGPAPAVEPEVIVQTRVADHPVLTALRTGGDAPFYDAELRARREFGYPPYASLVRIVAAGTTAAAARALAARAAAAARECGVEILGPAPAPGAGAGPPRIQCLLRAPDRAAVLAAARAVQAGVRPPAGGRLMIDVDPQGPLV